MNPLVSIIIPTYNRDHLISETLDTILLQTHVNWECIIVDDGSTDNTDQVLKKHLDLDKRFQYYKRPIDKAKGANACRNYGFELCKGTFVKWFDSDDLMYPNLLKDQLEIINNNDCCICKVVHYDAVNNKVLKENVIYSENLIQDYLVGNISFYISGPIWKKSFLEEHRILFNEDISNLDDWDFNLRMLYQKPNIVFIDKVLIKYRYHENSLSKEINKLNFYEIESEFVARKNHLKLIKINKMAKPKILENFIKDRYKYFFREAMINDTSEKKYFFKKLLDLQFRTFDIKIFKTITAFIVFSVFKKGYILFK